MSSEDGVVGGARKSRRQTVMGERPIVHVRAAAPRESLFVRVCFGAVYTLLHVGSNSLLWLFAGRKSRL